MGSRKSIGQLVVGYAAETEDLEANSRKKLVSKHADFIVGNLAGEGRAFAVDENEILLVDSESAEQVGPASKRELADAILDKVSALLAR